MARPEQRTDRLLEVLLDGEVQFAVVGGVAAIAHGATTATRDLDVIVGVSAENLDLLMKALKPHRPVHVTRRDLGVITLTGEDLLSYRLLLLETDLGRLDVLFDLEPIGPIDRLTTVELELLEGKRVRVLGIDDLIRVKAYLGRPKDKLVEAELRAIRALTTDE